MPELPEVETMVRGIRSAVEKSTLVEFSCCPCTRKPISLSPSLEEISSRVRGQKVIAVERLAKRVLLLLDSGDRFAIEPRMTGLMLLSDPPTQEHLRFCWLLRKGRKQTRLWFWDRRGLGTLQLLSAEQFAQQLGPDVLGPDALQMTPALWASQLQRTSRAIKIALLDQKLVAGIGNLYASEILHRVRVNPKRPADQLTRRQIHKLHQATQEVLNTAITYEGSTLSDGTYRNALNKAGGYQNEHQVYGKAGELCSTCQRQPIERIVQAQRSTFYCPRCQK